MSSFCKYIMLNHMDPILFPASWEHGVVASKFETRGIEITSAGFVSMFERDGVAEISTYGGSDSLRLRPDKKDSFIIKNFLKERY